MKQLQDIKLSQRYKLKKELLIIIAIRETLEFESNKFHQAVARDSTEYLRRRPAIASRKAVLNSFAVGVGVGGVVAAGSVSVYDSSPDSDTRKEPNCTEGFFSRRGS